MHVSPIFRTGPFAATVTVLALASAGCAGPNGISSTSPASLSPAPATPAAPEWWRKAGDPVLASIVTQGLDASEEITCRIDGLRHHDYQAAQETKRIGATLGRLLGADQKAKSDARALAHQDRVQRIVARRIRLARQIALSYVEVRRLQQEVALRKSLRSQHKDNAEVAQFRREAGLVSAIDGALARSQDQAAQGELDYAQGRLDEAISQLAGLVGETREALVGKLGTSGQMPDLPAGPALTDAHEAALAGATSTDPTLADNLKREARLTQALDQARRTVRDARGAYRQGAGDYATLYVAEAAVTAVSLALVNARAARVTRTLESWSAQDTAWARSGLDPVVTAPPGPSGTITVVADCD
jgi:outer membrane protein TolC